MTTTTPGLTASMPRQAVSRPKSENRVTPDPTESCNVTVLNNSKARTDVVNRLRRAEGQIRGIQRMVEEGEDCLKIGQQFSAVRKALDSTYLRMTVCFMEQELQSRMQPNPEQQADLDHMLKDMQTMLSRLS